MKLFSIKTVLGMAAIGGAAMYVRSQGGLQKTFDKLMTKKDELLAADQSRSKTARAASAPVEAETY